MAATTVLAFVQDVMRDIGEDTADTTKSDIFVRCER